MCEARSAGPPTPARPRRAIATGCGHKPRVSRGGAGPGDSAAAAQDPTEILDEYGADALRLYLINSPVVRAETLKFRREGVFSVLKDVMLPWYNAYRFLVQNALRWEAEAGARFEPLQARARPGGAARSRVSAGWRSACCRSMQCLVLRGCIIHK